MPRRPPEPDVGRRIRQQRLRQGLTQSQLAERVGAADETISRIERGKLAPSVDMLGRIAGVLGVSVDALLTKPVTKKRAPGERLALQRVVALIEPLTDAQLDELHRALKALLRLGGHTARPR